MRAFESLLSEMEAFTVLKETRYKDIQVEDFIEDLRNRFLVVYKKDVIRLDMKVGNKEQTIVNRKLNTE